MVNINLTRLLLVGVLLGFILAVAVFRPKILPDLSSPVTTATPTPSQTSTPTPTPTEDEDLTPEQLREWAERLRQQEIALQELKERLTKLQAESEARKEGLDTRQEELTAWENRLQAREEKLNAWAERLNVKEASLQSGERTLAATTGTPSNNPTNLQNEQTKRGEAKDGPRQNVDYREKLSFLTPAFLIVEILGGAMTAIYLAVVRRQR